MLRSIILLRIGALLRASIVGKPSAVVLGADGGSMMASTDGLRTVDVQGTVVNSGADIGNTVDRSASMIEKRRILRAANTQRDQNAAEKDYSESSDFQLERAVGSNHRRIPNRILLTGPFASFYEIFRHRSSADLRTWLGLSRDSHVVYYNDTHCRAYLSMHYDEELTKFFDAEKSGSYRGDLCRTAIILRDGGFYIDLDMQLRVPLVKLIDDATTFMTARAYKNGALNALIAAAPNSPVMHATLNHIRKWYRNETLQLSPMGPTTMQRGLEEVINKSCPNHNWTREDVFSCGNESGIRLYSEVKLVKCSRWGDVMCPMKRWKRKWDGLTFGLFSGDGMFRATKTARERAFIGWSRAEDCRSLGCRVSGGRRYPQ